MNVFICSEDDSLLPLHQLAVPSQATLTHTRDDQGKTSYSPNLQTVGLVQRLNIEVDLQSLFGLHVT
jgi:hypothetical protein